MTLALLVLAALVFVLLLAAHRSPVSGLDVRLSAVDAELDRPTVAPRAAA